jgi:hypothetical protein
VDRRRDGARWSSIVATAVAGSTCGPDLAGWLCPGWVRPVVVSRAGLRRACMRAGDEPVGKALRDAQQVAEDLLIDRC